MAASGNDFLVIDNRKGIVRHGRAFAANVCRPHIGIGADGVLLVDKPKKGDFRVRIFNADGSEAEACGNGFRCAGLYAHRLLGFPSRMRVDTLSGSVSIEVKKETVRVKMIDPYGYREQIRLAGLGDNSKTLHCAFINTGVPHAVIFAEALEGLNVSEIGRNIRYHKAFQPKGANVDFVEVRDKHALAVRTYERGVEGETLACGTGAAAAAVVGGLTNRVEPPVRVTPRSGEAMTVDFALKGSRIEDVFLEGGARFVFEGKFYRK